MLGSGRIAEQAHRPEGQRARTLTSAPSAHEPSCAFPPPPRAALPGHGERTARPGGADRPRHHGLAGERHLGERARPQGDGVSTWYRALKGVAAGAELRLRLARDRWRIHGHPFYRHVPSLRVPLSIVDGRIAVDPSAGFVYYRIPKAANSTVIWSLYRTASGRPEAGIEAAKSEAFACPSDLPPDAATRAATAFRHFTVVRNPFTRLASAYLDKIAGQEPQARRIADALGQPPERIRFHDFLDFLEHLHGLRRNAHWAPQTELILLPPSRLTYIAHMERLDQELPSLLRALYPDHEPRVERYAHKKHQASSRTASAAPQADQRLASLYDRSARLRVARLYENDFQAFGYDPERLPGVD